MAPKPRKALAGTLLVNTAREVQRTLGIRYGPVASAAPANSTRALSAGYAPASPRISVSWATMVPSFLAPVRYFIKNGCRFVLAWIDSCRVHIIRTGLPVCHANHPIYVA